MASDYLQATCHTRERLPKLHRKCQVEFELI